MTVGTIREEPLSETPDLGDLDCCRPCSNRREGWAGIMDSATSDGWRTQKDARKASECLEEPKMNQFDEIKGDG